MEFLSTLSLRRATFWQRAVFPHGLISIHALLAESDVPVRGARPKVRDFYPRSPCGERPGVVLLFCPVLQISIHALLAESDSKSAQNSGALLRI